MEISKDDLVFFGDDGAKKPKRTEDDIGFYDDYKDKDDLEVLNAMRAGIPNAVVEALNRKLVTRQELIDNEIIER